MTRSLGFIDARVPELDRWLDGPMPSATVHALLQARDGPNQIAEIVGAEDVCDLAGIVLEGLRRTDAVELRATRLDVERANGPDLVREKLLAALCPDAAEEPYSCRRDLVVSAPSCRSIENSSAWLMQCMVSPERGTSEQLRGRERPTVFRHGPDLSKPAASAARAPRKIAFINISMPGGCEIRPVRQSAAETQISVATHAYMPQDIGA